LESIQFLAKMLAITEVLLFGVNLPVEIIPHGGGNSEEPVYDARIELAARPRGDFVTSCIYTARGAIGAV
jgi:hypothetical protein